MSQDSERPLLILIDGHALAYRAHYALVHANLRTKSGEPTGAIRGFTSKLMDAMLEEPDYIAVTFDMGLSGREIDYPDYKANRAEMPDDLRIQLDRIQEMVRAFNIPVMVLDGYEADDIIGTITAQAEAQNCRVKILTGDRDLLQLLTGHVKIELPDRSRSKRAADVTWDIETFQAKYKGLTPPQLIDLKGLMGDSSDNIPGVKGIGEKGGLKLLNLYPSIEEIYENLDKITGANHKKLKEGRELAFLSKKLATIQRDIPIELNLQACVAHDFAEDKVRQFFDELEFTQLRNKLEELIALKKGDEYRAQKAFTPPHTIVTTPEQLDALVKKLNAAERIAFDTETTSVDSMQAELVGISLAVDEHHGYYIPVGHIAPREGEAQLSLFDPKPQAPPQLDLEKVIEAIRPALTNPDIPKVAHNASYDLTILRRYGIDVSPIADDTMIAEWVTDPGSNYLGLKNLAQLRLNVKMKLIDDLIGRGSKQITMDRVAIEKAAPYASADAVVTFRLVNPLHDELAGYEKSKSLYETLEIPLIPVIVDMEMAGVLIDEAYLQPLSAEMTGKLQDYEQQIYDLVGHEFNVNSLQQLNEVLFMELRISTEGLKKTKTGGFSLTSAVLEELEGREDHPIFPLLRDHRSLSKLLSTYVDALPTLINPGTGRVHTSFNQTGTVTGRFSSSNPDLQNIPIRTAEGRRVRQAFIAAEGHQLLSVDYSQIELRILAHFSGDETLRKAFEEGQDIHRATAAKVHGIAPEDVTYEQRRFAKSVNFGLMYGMGAFRLARESDLMLHEAEDFIKAYFENFPGVKVYLDGVKEKVAKTGYVETLFGRRRFFPVLLEGQKASHNIRSRAEREAINMPIQGTAADIVKKAMIELHHRLKIDNYRAKMLLQVHDELILEVPEDEIEKARNLVVETMESAGNILDVPVIADAHVGKNWAVLE